MTLWKTLLKVVGYCNLQSKISLFYLFNYFLFFCKTYLLSILKMKTSTFLKIKTNNVTLNCKTKNSLLRNRIDWNFSMLSLFFHILTYYLCCWKIDGAKSTSLNFHPHMRKSLTRSVASFWHFILHLLCFTKQCVQNFVPFFLNV